MPSSPSRLLAVVLALVVTATACGSEPATTAAPDSDPSANPSTGSVETDEPDQTDGAAPPAPADDAAAHAETNIDDLEPSDDVRTLEVLDVTTGQPTTIADAVTGDRPVLLWFWAPH